MTFWNRIFSSHTSQHGTSVAQAPAASTGSQSATHDAKPATELARAAATADPQALKVVVSATAAEAAAIAAVLTRVHGVDKNKIAQLGSTCSDEQIAQLLGRGKPIVIVPRDVINNRPCVFGPAPGLNRIIAICFMDGQATVLPPAEISDKFRFPPGWFVE